MGSLQRMSDARHTRPSFVILGAATVLLGAFFGVVGLALVLGVLG